jgi:hypothetical protein
LATRITVHASPLLLKRGVRGVTGQPLEIVVHLPLAPAFSVAGFEFDSAFPGAGILAALPQLAVHARERPDARLMLFGHADEAGGEDYNKRLSDRRAQAVLALLTHDLALFDRVAEDDAWKLIHYQAMLAVRGISPMQVDGLPGPITSDGVSAFQQAYNGSVYHPPGGRARAYQALHVDGELGPRTKAALRDAYLALVETPIESGRFFGPRFGGCGEFNRAGSPERDRRVSLALYGADFPTESKIPCAEGDAARCKVNKKTKHQSKCNFYRRTLEPEQFLDGGLLATAGHALRLDPRIAEPSRFTLQVGELRQSGMLEPGASILAQLPAAQGTGELSVWPARFASPEEAGDQATVWELDIRDLPPVDRGGGARPETHAGRLAQPHADARGAGGGCP